MKEELDESNHKLKNCLEEINSFREKLIASEQLNEDLNKELGRERSKPALPNLWMSSEIDRSDARSATSAKKINTVRPLTRSEVSQPILENHSESTGSGDRVDVAELKEQCKNLEDQLDQVKQQILKIVTDRNDNDMNMNIAGETMNESAETVIDSDRTSPDGQERDKDQDGATKSSDQYETEIDRLLNLNKALESKLEEDQKSLQSLDELKQKNKDLEESLELIREEFESMEDYWQKKLDDERSFYEEQLKISERQFKDLENRMKEYDEVLLETRHKDTNHLDDDKLSTIEETFSLECQVLNCN